MAMTNEQLTKWIDEIFGTIDEIKTNSGDITTLTKDVSDLKKQTAGTISLAKAQLQRFTDGSATQALDLVADIIPVQAGSGVPSPTNVRTISGYSSVTATAAGKNLLKKYTSETVYGVSFVTDSDGSVSADGTATNTINKEVVIDEYELPFSGSYILSGCPSGGGASSYQMWIYDITASTPLGGEDTGSGMTVTLDRSHKYSVRIRVANGYSIDKSFYPMLRAAFETDPTYKPYQANIATLSLGRTIYGGSADFTTGAETETLVGENIGTSTAITWEDAPALHAQGVFPFTISGADYATESWMAEKYKIVYGNNWEVENGQIKVTVTAGGSVGCRLCDTTYTTLEALKTALTGSMLIHPITTPNTYTTTPAQLSLLQGENNVSATSGPITLTYAPDNVLAEVYAYIQKRIDTLAASLTANRTTTRKTTKTLTKKED